MSQLGLDARDRWVGAFVIGSLGVLLLVTFLLVQRQHIFVERQRYWTLFDDAKGLAVQSPVRISGIEVGKVSAVELTADNKVRVEFSVLRKYANRMVRDSVSGALHHVPASGDGTRVALPGGLSLEALFPVGNGLSIIPGDPQNPRVEPGGFVAAQYQPGLMASLKDSGLLDRMRAIVDEAALLLGRVNDPQGPFWQSLDNLQNLSEQAQSGQGILGEVMQPQSPLYKKVQSSLNSLEASMRHVQRSTTSIENVTSDVEGKMQQVQLLVDNLEKFSQDAALAGRGLRRFADQSEKIPPLTRDAIINLNGRIDDLGVMISNIKKTMPFGLGKSVGEDTRRR